MASNHQIIQYAVNKDLEDWNLLKIMSNPGNSRLASNVSLQYLFEFVLPWLSVCLVDVRSRQQKVKYKHVHFQWFESLFCLHWCFRHSFSNSGSGLRMHHGSSSGSVYVIRGHSTLEEKEASFVGPVVATWSCGDDRSWGKPMDCFMTRVYRQHHHSSHYEWLTFDDKQ